MNERQIEQALRQGPPDEPPYIHGAARAVAPDETGPATFHDRLEGPNVRVGPGAQARRESVGRLGWILPLAAVVTIAVVGLVLRLDLGPAATPSIGPNDALGQIIADGVVHIAVSDEAPQARTTGDAYMGFDVDVANAVAEKLGVSPDVLFVPPDEILRGDGGWELAFPSHALPATLTGALAGPGYYVWPAWLVVRAESTADSIVALNGSAICVVEDSPGAAWLSGASARDTAYITSAPSDAAVVQRATDEDCLAALASGDALAAVTSSLLNTDFASRGLRVIGGAPVIRQQRALLVRDAGALDPTTLQAAVVAAITDLRSSGRLTELSRRAFGGEDLTGDLP